MTRTTGLAGLAMALVLLTGGNSLAQGSGNAERLDRLFAQIDLDGSGTLTEREVRAAAAARFAALDLDGDGAVGARERGESMNDRMRDIFEEADRDGNGRLDVAEIHDVAIRRADRRLARLDTDGDGMLSLEELQRARPGAGSSPAVGGAGLTLARLEAGMVAMFRRADADGDGIVTLREATDGANR